MKSFKFINLYYDTNTQSFPIWNDLYTKNWLCKIDQKWSSNDYFK